MFGVGRNNGIRRWYGLDSVLIQTVKKSSFSITESCVKILGAAGRNIFVSVNLGSSESEPHGRLSRVGSFARSRILYVYV